jgi:hypothetical protein
MSNLHFKKKGKKEASRYAERAGMMVATGFHDNGCIPSQHFRNGAVLGWFLGREVAGL